MYGKLKVAALVVVGAAAAQEGGRTVWDGVYSASQAELGMHRYTGPCGSCHGRTLTGGNIFGSRTRTAPALKGDAFLAHWTGHSVDELFYEITTYMPLDHPGGMSDEANASILAFILRENGFPAGAHELPADLTVMKAIQITGPKK